MRAKHLQNSSSLKQRAVVQEFMAAMAAEAAHEAERTGQTDMASVMLTTARRCRSRAVRLRAQAQAAADARQ
jgi:hypothetical protein